MPNKLLTKRRNRYNIFHRPPPGSSPGTVIDPIDPTPTRLALMAYDQDKLDARNLDDIPGLVDLVKLHQVTWISVIGLGNVPLIQKLCQELGIHRRTGGDIINQYQRPQVGYFDTYSFITVHIPRLDARNESEHVSIIIGQGFVVSFQNSPIDYMESIRNRIQKKVGQIRFKGCDYLCYAIIDAVIDLYFPIAEYFAQGLYPALLGPEALPTPTRDWLAAHPDAPAALRRLISEGLATVERALVAQARDAKATR